MSATGGKRIPSCGAVLAPNQFVTPVADDRRIVFEAKFEPELVVPQALAPTGHSAEHEATAFLSVGINNVPPHREPPNGNVHNAVPIIGWLKPDRVCAFWRVEGHAE